MSVTEIEAAITELTSKDLDELISWLAEHHARVWDRQIEEDLEAGRLDAVLTEVDKEYDTDLMTLTP
jgi:hypothetical protein